MRKLLTMVIITAILAALAMSMTGCKKTVEEGPAWYQVPQEVMDYLVLPEGKYFIYLDSATGQTDSVIIKECSVQKVYKPAHMAPGFFGMAPYLVPACYTDSIILRMTSESGVASVNWLLINQIQLAGTIQFYYDITLSPGWGVAFWTPATKVFVNDDRYGGFFIPSMSVEGVAYNSVLRLLFTAGTPSNPGYRRSNYYWAKGIGLIRKEIITDTATHAWTLLRKG